MSAKSAHRGWGHIRKLESGRFQASFVGPDSRRYTGPRPFDTKMLAEGWLARERERIMLADYNGHRWISPVERKGLASVRGQTVTEYGQCWIAGRNIKPRTRAHYESILAQHITPTLGGIPVAELTADTVNRWYSTLLTGRPTARAHTYSLLHAICASAVEQELLTRNPCAIKRAMTTNRKREPVLLSVNELAAVADAIRPERFKAMVLLSAWGALRFGEAIELRRKDIGDGCGTITVARGVTHLTAGNPAGRCQISTPKSGKSRTVVLPPHIRADVKHHLDSFVDPDPDALLFGSARGACHLSQTVFREAFNKACESVGREGVTIHALRHLGATLAARAGGTVADVQARLGHTTVRAAMAYQHSVNGRDADIAAALSLIAESA